MTDIRISCGKFHQYKSLFNKFQLTHFISDNLKIEGNNLFHSWTNTTGNKFYLFGYLVGIRQADGSLSPPTLIKIDPGLLENPDLIPNIEGRFVLLKVHNETGIEIWTDQYGRIDIYCQKIEGGYIFASGMDALPISIARSELNEVGLAHSLAIYGSRPAKQDTIYKNVTRLGVNQGFFYKDGALSILLRKFKPRTISPVYEHKDLNRYANFFIEAIRSRSSSDGNIVYLSSGWDSTAILATLIHLHGNRKVKAIIGRMRYSDRSGVINQFEIDRAKAFAEYYSIELVVVELDYTKDVGNILGDILPIFRSQQFASLVGINHWKLAEAAARISNGNEAIFAGEISDGAHNLGFSQYVTIFHPASRDFREYSDKMASYLFGPTFYQQILNGTYKVDPVWNIFLDKNSQIKLDKAADTKEGITNQLLSSFFLRPGRLPFYSINNTKLLTTNGAHNYSSISESKYFGEILQEITPDNLYSFYLHLYHSFHWQGSTVSTLEHTAVHHGLKCHMPFYDSQIIDFLSAMPEDWGRGLDLNNTKYPLKWMLQNRIDYPYEYQSGPHAYTYDIRPEFSLGGEILHSSSYSPIFKSRFREKSFINLLNEEYFDLSYIDKTIKKYLEGEELLGQEVADILSLGNHSLVGVY
ncbi:asparagine synthase-related protein [Polynucleobacter bastaniensis]|uniref:asparagine synthase-related protein n=1 Tax=Polynucleobacter bastaniensis TaxID=2081039 RepID=UPI001C0D2493|nr:asparagine synthase-related protein [Polynucleobacter bastaniensis]MBU3598263.1 hypothetical protein [Polynucleobacter bastaniensis]